MSRNIPWNQNQSGSEYVFIGDAPTVPAQRYTVVGDRIEETKTVVVHEFTMGDVEDPDLYAAEPLWKWQQSEQGAWVMEHAVESPVWHRQADPYNYGHQYAISAKLTAKDLTYFYLKWGNNIDNRTT